MWRSGHEAVAGPVCALLMRFLERFGARSGLLAAGLLALTACQSPSADATAMSSQQKEVYAYNEGAITALEGHLLAAVELSPDRFDPEDDHDHEALIKQTRATASSYTDALQSIQASLKDGPCKSAQAAYLKLEQQELGVINAMLDALADGDGAGAKAAAKTYKELTSSAESQAIDQTYLKACGLSSV